MQNKAGNCPVCGRAYVGAAAISRKDHKTPVCPFCGLVEALRAAGLNQEEAEGLAREARKAEIKALMKDANLQVLAGYKRGLRRLPQVPLHAGMIRGWLLGREMADLEEAAAQAGADHGAQG